ncbi:hypothetical protein ACGFQG_32915 [Nocardia fluminea]|uniref:hypothetical protein n=1 Tax=Nocardia fluminea TaxID=134984 RepID=UPI003423978B
MRIDIEHTATVCDSIAAAFGRDRQVIPPSGSRDDPREALEWETAFAVSALAWTAFLGG